MLAHVCADLVQICAEKQEKTGKKKIPLNKGNPSAFYKPQSLFELTSMCLLV